MNRSIFIINKNSNEIYALTYPRSVQNFCEYDFSYFHDRCVDLCNEAIKTGDYDLEQLAELRSSLKGCHIYYEQNIRIIYEKIVTDCWIDYLCRKDSIGTSGLWNRFMGCNTPFERAMFNRLCEYRYNHAINQWLNLIRIQEYARKKMDFLFDAKASGADEVKIRRNYFDLMFNVTACELGCNVSEIATTRIYTPGRIPNSPFIMSQLTKDILKNNLSDLNYDESFEGIEPPDELSDQLAMDAFARMKNSLPKRIDTMNIAERSMKNLPKKVYMPTSFKAVIDLEFDVLLEDEAVLQRCAMCGRYYVKDSEYTSDYCNKVSRHGMTCLEIYERDNPRSKIPQELQSRCEEAEIYMLNRMGKDLSRAEYDGWRDYLHAMMGKVESGEMPKEELESFVEYSKKIDISKSEPVKAPIVQKEQTSRGIKTVRPFVPERIDRSVLEEQQRQYEPEPYYPFSRYQQEPRSEPRSEQRAEQRPEPRPQSAQQRAQEKTPTARIIRGGQNAYRSPEPVQSYRNDFSQTAEIPIAKPVIQAPAPEKPIIPPIEKSTEAPKEKPSEKTVEEEFDEFLPFIKTAGIKKNAAAISAYGKAVNTAEQGFDEHNANERSSSELDEIAEIHATKAKNTNLNKELENPFADISSIFDGIEQGDEELVSRPKPIDEAPVSVIHGGKANEFMPADFSEDFAEDNDVHIYTPKLSEEPKKPSQKAQRTTRSTSAPSKKDSSVPDGIWTEDRKLFVDVEEKAPESKENGDELSTLTAKTTQRKTVQRTAVKKKSTNKTQHVFDAILKGTPNDKNIKK